MNLQQGQYTNIYRAIVISNKDPAEIGRVQVRVPFLHGVNTQAEYIKDEFLPYAMPCTPIGGHDSGMFLVPEVGTMVFVMFEDGDADKPVYLGQTFSKGANETQEIGYTESGAFKKSKVRYKYPDMDDTPKGTYKAGVLRRHTLYKSPKGATIQFNEDDEKESLEIFDRLGQLFIMHGPRSEDDNDGGYRNRGLFSVLKRKFKGSIFKKAIILLKAISGSFLRFISSDDTSDVDLVSVYKDDKAGIHISVGDEDRVLVFYKDSSFEIKESSITLKSKTINLDGDLVNIKAGTIRTSSNIYVTSVSAPNVKAYINKEEEKEIEDLYDEDIFYDEDEV